MIQFLLQRRRELLCCILLLTVGFSLRLQNIEMREDEETFISTDDPVLAQFRKFQQQFENEEGVVVAYESDSLFSEQEIRYLAALQARLEQLPGVTEVRSLINAEKIKGLEGGLDIAPLIDTTAMDRAGLLTAEQLVSGDPLFEGVNLSADHRVAALILTLPGILNKGSDSICKAFYPQLMELVKSEKKNFNRILHVGGDVVTDSAVEALMNRDLAMLFPISLLFSALVLFVFFRKTITTLVPLVPVLLAIVWVLGLKGWTNIPLTPVSITLFPLIMVIGLANSIHIISHYRKIRPGHTNNYEAMYATLQRILKPGFMAAFTTAVGFASLGVSKVTGISQMGLFAAFGVMSAYVLSLIIIPSALLVSKVFSQDKQKQEKRNDLDHMLVRIDGLNQRRPKTLIVAFIVVTLIMALYIPNIRVEGSMASFAREKTTLRRDIQFIDQHLSGINSFELILTGNEEAFKQPEILRGIDRIESELERNDHVLKVFSVSTLLKTITQALHEGQPDQYVLPQSREEIAQSYFLYEISGGDELSSFIDESYSTARLTIRTRQLKNEEQKAFLAELNRLASQYLPETNARVTGMGMLMSHINDNLILTQVESVLMALGLILLLMLVLFGIKGGLLSILPNIFPIVFFLGLMGLFGIELNLATSIIASVTIGIVVDDTIHIFYGYKQEMRELNDPSPAIHQALRKVGAAMCVTSLLLVLGFGILTLSESRFIADFGVLSASSIAAALFADLFVSPILLKETRLFNHKIK